MNVSTRAGPGAAYNYEMEVLGYQVRKGLGRPGHEILDGVANEIDALFSQSAPSEAASISVKGGPRCGYFIEHGLDFLDTVKSYIRDQYPVRQSLKIVRLLRSQQGRVHMKRDQSISIIKVAPGRDLVTFRLSLPGSPLQGAVSNLVLREDELLFVLGSVTLEIEDPNDTAIIWVGYSSNPVGMDILNTDVLDFVLKGAHEV
ncbi:hypothetical protein TSTA_037130 [Talaromyces stipitatus ATCC 10500]|uniref:Uncharacterized protein n=1 Tax=Talaromyces stipitatus (strain ATCC 10500 / CBS 375.48 / QM 6759 / NRRL 1006) TaxID=441959 RepID=B8M8I0_TALSN|nr:uncharacterized protein TSTA_037130 [Talaromyces stipitatus ATCC 10500]EED20493.1 hypothetical protein TSTA_037130 [Talaromyces stipitatus ATCC 10500]